MSTTTAGWFGLVVAGLLVAGCGLIPRRPADLLSADEHNELGVAYYARGEHTLAAREFRQALARRPGWSRALVHLGDALLAQGDLDAALHAYERAQAASPGDPAIANNLAWALLQHEGRWSDAEPLIRAALGQRPEPRGYYLDTLGVLLLRKGEPRPALAAFREALADPLLRDHRVRALVLQHAGEALLRLGDPDGAEECHRSARALVGGDPGANGPGPSPTGPTRGEVGGGDAVC